MFQAVTRLLKPEPPRYARRVARELLRDGFDPRALDEMRVLGSFSQGSCIFAVLAELKLRPLDAALAVRNACHLYQTHKRMAEASGWPLKDARSAPPGLPPHEAWFLELLLEAGRALRFAH